MSQRVVTSLNISKTKLLDFLKKDQIIRKKKGNIWGNGEKKRGHVSLETTQKARREKY